MRSVDETQHHTIGTAQRSGALDDGPEHHVEVGRGPPHRGQHRVGGRDLFPSIVEIPPKVFTAEASTNLAAEPSVTVSLRSLAEAGQHLSLGREGASPAVRQRLRGAA